MFSKWTFFVMVILVVFSGVDSRRRNRRRSRISTQTSPRTTADTTISRRQRMIDMRESLADSLSTNRVKVFLLDNGSPQLVKGRSAILSMSARHEEMTATQVMRLINLLEKRIRDIDKEILSESRQATNTQTVSLAGSNPSARNEPSNRATNSVSERRVNEVSRRLLVNGRLRTPTRSSGRMAVPSTFRSETVDRGRFSVPLVRNRQRTTGTAQQSIDRRAFSSSRVSPSFEERLRHSQRSSRPTEGVSLNSRGNSSPGVRNRVVKDSEFQSGFTSTGRSGHAAVIQASSANDRGQGFILTETDLKNRAPNTPFRDFLTATGPSNSKQPEFNSVSETKTTHEPTVVLPETTTATSKAEVGGSVRNARPKLTTNQSTRFQTEVNEPKLPHTKTSPTHTPVTIQPSVGKAASPSTIHVTPPKTTSQTLHNPVTTVSDRVHVVPSNTEPHPVLIANEKKDTLTEPLLQSMPQEEPTNPVLPVKQHTPTGGPLQVIPQAEPNNPVLPLKQHTPTGGPLQVIPQAEPNNPVLLVPEQKPRTDSVLPSPAEVKPSLSFVQGTETPKATIIIETPSKHPVTTQEKKTKQVKNAQETNSSIKPTTSNNSAKSLLTSEIPSTQQTLADQQPSAQIPSPTKMAMLSTIDSPKQTFSKGKLPPTSVPNEPTTLQMELQKMIAKHRQQETVRTGSATAHEEQMKAIKQLLAEIVGSPSNVPVTQAQTTTPLPVQQILQLLKAQEVNAAPQVQVPQSTAQDTLFRDIITLMQASETRPSSPTQASHVNQLPYNQQHLNFNGLPMMHQQAVVDPLEQQRLAMMSQMGNPMAGMFGGMMGYMNPEMMQEMMYGDTTDAPDPVKPPEEGHKKGEEQEGVITPAPTTPVPPTTTVTMAQPLRHRAPLKLPPNHYTVRDRDFRAYPPTRRPSTDNAWREMDAAHLKTRHEHLLSKSDALDSVKQRQRPMQPPLSDSQIRKQHQHKENALGAHDNIRRHSMLDNPSRRKESFTPTADPNMLLQIKASIERALKSAGIAKDVEIVLTDNNEEQTTLPTPTSDNTILTRIKTSIENALQSAGISKNVKLVLKSKNKGNKQILPVTKAPVITTKAVLKPTDSSWITQEGSHVTDIQTKPTTKTVNKELHGGMSFLSYSERPAKIPVDSSNHVFVQHNVRQRKHHESSNGHPLDSLMIGHVPTASPDHKTPELKHLPQNVELLGGFTSHSEQGNRLTGGLDELHKEPGRETKVENGWKTLPTNSHSSATNNVINSRDKPETIKVNSNTNITPPPMNENRPNHRVVPHMSPPKPVTARDIPKKSDKSDIVNKLIKALTTSKHKGLIDSLSHLLLGKQNNQEVNEKTQHPSESSQMLKGPITTGTSSGTASSLKPHHVSPPVLVLSQAPNKIHSPDNHIISAPLEPMKSNDKVFENMNAMQLNTHQSNTNIEKPTADNTMETANQSPVQQAVSSQTKNLLEADPGIHQQVAAKHIALQHSVVPSNIPRMMHTTKANTFSGANLFRRQTLLLPPFINTHSDHKMAIQPDGALYQHDGPSVRQQTQANQPEVSSVELTNIYPKAKGASIRTNTSAYTFPKPNMSTLEVTTRSAYFSSDVPLSGPAVPLSSSNDPPSKSLIGDPTFKRERVVDGSISPKYPSEKAGSSEPTFPDYFQTIKPLEIPETVTMSTTPGLKPSEARPSMKKYPKEQINQHHKHVTKKTANTIVVDEGTASQQQSIVQDPDYYSYKEAYMHDQGNEKKYPVDNAESNYNDVLDIPGKLLGRVRKSSGSQFSNSFWRPLSTHFKGHSQATGIPILMNLFAPTISEKKPVKPVKKTQHTGFNRLAGRMEIKPRTSHQQIPKTLFDVSRHIRIEKNRNTPAPPKIINRRQNVLSSIPRAYRLPQRTLKIPASKMNSIKEEAKPKKKQFHSVSSFQHRREKPTVKLDRRPTHTLGSRRRQASQSHHAIFGRGKQHSGKISQSRHNILSSVLPPVDDRLFSRKVVFQQQSTARHAVPKKTSRHGTTRQPVKLRQISVQQPPRSDLPKNETQNPVKNSFQKVAPKIYFSDRIKTTTELKSKIEPKVSLSLYLPHITEEAEKTILSNSNQKDKNTNKKNDKTVHQTTEKSSPNGIMIYSEKPSIFSEPTTVNQQLTTSTPHTPYIKQSTTVSYATMDETTVQKNNRQLSKQMTPSPIDFNQLTLDILRTIRPDIHLIEMTNNSTTTEKTNMQDGYIIKESKKGNGENKHVERKTIGVSPPAFRQSSESIQLKPSSLTTPTITLWPSTTKSSQQTPLQKTTPIVTAPQTRTKYITIPQTTADIITTPQTKEEIALIPKATEDTATTKQATAEIVTAWQAMKEIVTTPQTTEETVTTPQTTAEHVTNSQATREFVTSLQATAEIVTTRQATEEVEVSLHETAEIVKPSKVAEDNETDQKTSIIVTTPQAAEAIETNLQATEETEITPKATAEIIKPPQATAEIIKTPQATTNILIAPQKDARNVTTPQVAAVAIETNLQATKKTEITPQATAEIIKPPQATTNIVIAPQIAAKIVTTPQTAAPIETNMQATEETEIAPQATAEIIKPPQATTNIVIAPQKAAKNVSTPQAAAAAIETNMQATEETEITPQAIAEIIKPSQATTEITKHPQATTNIVIAPQIAAKIITTTQAAAAIETNMQAMEETEITPQATEEVEKPPQSTTNIEIVPQATADIVTVSETTTRFVTTPQTSTETSTSKPTTVIIPPQTTLPVLTSRFRTNGVLTSSNLITPITNQVVTTPQATTKVITSPHSMSDVNIPRTSSGESTLLITAPEKTILQKSNTAASTKSVPQAIQLTNSDTLSSHVTTSTEENTTPPVTNLKETVPLSAAIIQLTARFTTNKPPGHGTNTQEAQNSQIYSTHDVELLQMADPLVHESPSESPIFHAKDTSTRSDAPSARSGMYKPVQPVASVLQNIKEKDIKSDGDIIRTYQSSLKPRLVLRPSLSSREMPHKTNKPNVKVHQDRTHVAVQTQVKTHHQVSQSEYERQQQQSFLSKNQHINSHDIGQRIQEHQNQQKEQEQQQWQRRSEPLQNDQKPLLQEFRFPVDTHRRTRIIRKEQTKHQAPAKSLNQQHNFQPSRVGTPTRKQNQQQQRNHIQKKLHRQQKNVFKPSQATPTKTAQSVFSMSGSKYEKVNHNSKVQPLITTTPPPVKKIKNFLKTFLESLDLQSTQSTQHINSTESSQQRPNDQSLLIRSSGRSQPFISRTRSLSHTSGSAVLPTSPHKQSQSQSPSQQKANFQTSRMQTYSNSIDLSKNNNWAPQQQSHTVVTNKPQTTSQSKLRNMLPLYAKLHQSKSPHKRIIIPTTTNTISTTTTDPPTPTATISVKSLLMQLVQQEIRDSIQAILPQQPTYTTVKPTTPVPITTTTSTPAPTTTTVETTTPARAAGQCRRGETKQYHCEGRDMFYAMPSIVHWCVGMCLRGACIDSVCLCNATCVFTPVQPQEEALGSAISSALTGKSTDTGSIEIALQSLLATLEMATSANPKGAERFTPYTSAMSPTSSYISYESDRTPAPTTAKPSTTTVPSISGLLASIEKLIETKLRSIKPSTTKSPLLDAEGERIEAEDLPTPATSTTERPPPPHRRYPTHVPHLHRRFPNSPSTSHNRYPTSPPPTRPRYPTTPPSPFREQQSGWERRDQPAFHRRDQAPTWQDRRDQPRDPWGHRSRQLERRGWQDPWKDSRPRVTEPPPEQRWGEGGEGGRAREGSRGGDQWGPGPTEFTRRDGPPPRRWDTTPPPRGWQDSWSRDQSPRRDWGPRDRGGWGGGRTTVDPLSRWGDRGFRRRRGRRFSRRSTHEGGEAPEPAD